MDPVVAAAVADAHRTEWARVLAAAARLTGDLDAAEECAQDAYADALVSWTSHGVPDRRGPAAGHGHNPPPRHPPRQAPPARRARRRHRRRPRGVVGRA